MKTKSKKITSKSTTKESLSKDIMDQIKSKQIKMKSKGYFVLGSILLGIGLASALLITLTFLTVSTFHLRTSHPVGFLRYGHSGNLAFIRLFPFKPILISILGIIGGLALLKKYDISYKKSFLGISLGLIAGLTTIAIIADKVGVNDRLRETKPLKAVYKQDLTREDMLMGEVISASESSMIVKNPRTNQITTLKWNNNTSIQNTDGFEIGDHVGAIGEMVDGEFNAEGIHEGGMGWRQPPPPSSENVKPILRVKGVNQRNPKPRLK